MELRFTRRTAFLMVWDVLATFLYRSGFSSKGGNHYGYASAIGVVLVALCLLSTFVINKVFKTENYEM